MNNANSYSSNYEVRTAHRQVKRGHSAAPYPGARLTPNIDNGFAEAGRLVASLMAEHFVARKFPSSLRAPSRNRDEYAAFQSWSLTLSDSYTAAETDIIVGEAQRKVLYHLDAGGTAPAGQHQNQYIHKLTLTDDGKLVHQFDAFMNSMPIVTWM